MRAAVLDAPLVPFRSDLDWATIGAVNGVRLSAYGGDAADLPAEVLQAFLDDVAAGRLTVPVDRTYTLDEISAAHADMEAGDATGKLVVLP
jgi:NADPH2:quinone reductase